MLAQATETEAITQQVSASMVRNMVRRDGSPPLTPD